MRIATTVSRDISEPLEKVFDIANDVDAVPDLFVGWGPIPPVVAARIDGGGAIGAGRLRLIETSDGATLREPITVFERPSRVEYSLQGIPAPFSFLVREGHAQWHCRKVEGGTRVEWEYAFDVTGVLSWPLAFPLIRVTWRRMMERVLSRLDQRATVIE
jgi:carbon monoxide dehydrogenase subunit G